MPFEVGTLSELELDSRTYLKNLQLDLNLIWTLSCICIMSMFLGEFDLNSFLHLHNGYVSWLRPIGVYWDLFMWLNQIQIKPYHWQRKFKQFILKYEYSKISKIITYFFEVGTLFDSFFFLWKFWLKIYNLMIQELVLKNLELHLKVKPCHW
jgi:hypothetical protein